MGILIPLFGIGAGIIAIISGAYLKSKKIDLEKLRLKQESSDQNLEGKLKKLSAENEALQDRISNLETIIVSKEWDTLLSAPKNNDNESNVRAIAEKL